MNKCGNGCQYFAGRHYGDRKQGFCEHHLIKIVDKTKEGCDEYSNYDYMYN